MTKKILMAGFACWSVMAVAQASGSKDQAASAAKDTHPKEVANGQASGNVAAPKDLSTGHSSGKAAQPAGSAAVLNSSDAAASQAVEAPRDIATGQSSGKRQYQPVEIKTVSDELTPGAREQQSMKATGKTAQDDWAARVAKGDVNGDGKADVAATTSSSSSASSSSGGNGQARVAAADVNGDGKADAAINTSHSNIKNGKDAASGQTSGKRQHDDVTVTKSTDSAPQK